MSTAATVEECPGCEHAMRMHFKSATGEVVCLVSDSGVSSSGVIGIPWTSRCDCVNHQSEATDRRRSHEAAKKAEREEWKKKFSTSIRRAMEDNPPPSRES